MNAEAQAAIEWTRGRLSAAQRRFLAELPLTLQDDDRLYVHSEASNPPRWRYVQNTADAARSIVGDRSPRHLLRPHPSAGAVFDVFDREDDELRPDRRASRCNCFGGRHWLAVLGSVGQPRDGDPAASFAMFDTGTQRNHLLPRALRRRGGRAADSRKRPAALAGRSPRWSGGERWPRPSVQPGAVIDGFTIGERVHSGGMATLWSVTRPDIDGAAVDEDPAGFRRRGSRRHRQFRDGADDPAAVVGTARAGLLRHRRFRAPGLCRDRADSGQNALQPAWRSAACVTKRRAPSSARSRWRLPTCIGRTSSITTSSRAASCFAPPAKPC